MPQDEKTLDTAVSEILSSFEQLGKTRQLWGKSSFFELPSGSTACSSSSTTSSTHFEDESFNLDCLPESNTLLFSSRRQLFHSLDEGLRSLTDVAVDLDWISNQSFSLDSVHAAEYDLFFLDIGFFSKDDTDNQLQRISELAAHPQTPPIILISDKDSLRLTLRALYCGVADYLFREEIEPKLIHRMLQYAESSKSGKNEIFDRRLLPDQKSITSALEFSLLEESNDEHTAASNPQTIPLDPAKRTRAASGVAEPTWSRLQDESILQSLPFPLARVSKAGAIAFANPAFSDLFLDETLQYISPRSLADCGIHDELDNLINNPQQNGRCISRLQLETSKGRAWFDISVSPVRFGAEFLVFFQDVTEHIRAQDALKVSESRLRHLLRHLPVAIWTIDSDLRLFLSNKVDWLPAALSSNRALSLHDLFETEDPNAEPILLAKKALRGESVSIQLVLDDVEYLIQIEPNRDKSGRIIGAVGVTVNMSERLALQQRREQHDKFESLAALARGIAHDFNNLLVSIVGNASLISLDLPVDSPARPRLGKITKAAECASDFTSQLLAYSGTGTTDREELQLSNVAEEMLELLVDSFPRHIKVESECEADLPNISADPTQIRQVAMNLIKNAGDALGEKGGHIKISTELRSPDGKKPRHLCFSVQDTGPGMNEKTRRKIFDPFFSTKAAGRGLGLATVLGVVKAHQAKIEVESAPNLGTTFRVFFPIRK